MSWLPKKLVVVPIDFTDESFAAAEAALSFVDTASDIHLIHVLPHLSPMDPGVVWDTVDDSSRQDHAEDALRAKLKGDAYEGINVAVSIGDPGHEIAAFAEETKAELIILPSHGQSTIKRILIGSVTERVVRLAHCPVLVIKK